MNFLTHDSSPSGSEFRVQGSEFNPEPRTRNSELSLLLRLHFNGDMVLPTALAIGAAHWRGTNPPPVLGWAQVNGRARDLEPVHVDRHVKLVGFLRRVGDRRTQGDLYRFRGALVRRL